MCSHVSACRRQRARAETKTCLRILCEPFNMSLYLFKRVSSFITDATDAKLVQKVCVVRFKTLLV